MADALDDKRIDEWIHIVSDSLVQYTLSDSCTGFVHEVDNSLSSLSESLQHRIFAAAACSPSRLYSLLHLLPAHHHTALVAATIAPDKSLQAPFYFETLSVRILKAIASLPPSPTSFLALHVYDHALETMPWRAELHDSLEIAQHLAQVLHRHSSLISLRISMSNVDATSANLLFKATATLTCLQSLHLGGKEIAFPAHTAHLLQPTIRNLPHLQSLTLMLGDSIPESAERPIDADSSSPQPCCLTTALSHATSLTSLHISIDEAVHKRYFTAATALSLPNLSRLTAILEGNHDLTTAFLSRLAAPLTCLDLGDDFPACLHTHAAAAAQQFLTCFAKFPHLRSLAAVLPMDYVADSSVFDIMSSRAPAVLASLQHLRELSIGAECPVLHQAMPFLAARLTSLTQLHLRFWRSRFESAVPWPEFFRQLCRMKLQHLDLDMAGMGCSGPGMAALRPLAQLSVLQVSGWHCLPSTADCVALAGMTRLRLLSLNQAVCSRTPHGHAARALLELSSLTSLMVRGDTGFLDGFLADRLGVHAPHWQAAWPALQELSLDFQSSSVKQAERMLRSAVKLPELQRVSFQLSYDDTSDDGFGSATGTMHVDDPVGTLMGIAAEAGLKLQLSY